MAWRMELGHVALTVRLPVLRRISSSGHPCSDWFRLDQLPWPVLAERHRTMVNCTPNCNPTHDSWAQLVAVFKAAICPTQISSLAILGRIWRGRPAGTAA